MFDMFLSLFLSFFLSFFSVCLSLVRLNSAHDIKKKKNESKFLLIGSNEKKKSQYKVKIQISRRPKMSSF